MFLLVQYLLNSSLTMSSLVIYLFILEGLAAITSKLFLLSYFTMYFFENLIRFLLIVAIMELKLDVIYHF